MTNDSVPVYDPTRLVAHVAETEAEITRERSVADALRYHADGHERTADRLHSQLTALRNLVGDEAWPGV